MYTVGYVTAQKPQENEFINYLTEKSWNLRELDIDKKLNNLEDLDAVIVFEDTMSTTCSWLIRLKNCVVVPIYLLSNTDESSSNIIYLQLGVEACFRMKLEAQELYFTLNNLLAHYSKKDVYSLENRSESKSSSTELSELQLIPNNLSVLIDGTDEILLTKTEFQVLEMLYNSPSKAISYQELIEKIWDTKINEDSKNYRIANVIFHLRNKIEPSIGSPRFIKTVRSKGYMLDMK